MSVRLSGVYRNSPKHLGFLDRCQTRFLDDISVLYFAHKCRTNFNVFTSLNIWHSIFGWIVFASTIWLRSRWFFYRCVWLRSRWKLIDVYINFHFTDQLQCFALMLVFQNSAVLDRSLQPYESHIPFILQFLVNTFWQLSHLVGALFFFFLFSVLRIKHAQCGCQMN